MWQLKGVRGGCSTETREKSLIFSWQPVECPGRLELLLAQHPQSCWGRWRGAERGWKRDSCSSSGDPWPRLAEPDLLLPQELFWEVPVPRGNRSSKCFVRSGDGTRDSFLQCPTERPELHPKGFRSPSPKNTNVAALGALNFSRLEAVGGSV